MTRVAEAISTTRSPDSSAVDSRRVLLQISAVSTQPDEPHTPTRSGSPTGSARSAAVEITDRIAAEKSPPRAARSLLAQAGACCVNAARTLYGWSRHRSASLGPMRPVPRKLWVLMISVTCISFTGLVLSHVLRQDDKHQPDNPAEHEIVDEFKDAAEGAFRIATPTPPTEMQPLSVAATQQTPFGGAAEAAAAPPVQSAIYQSSGGKRTTGAWLEGTIIEDEFDATATNVNYDASRPRSQ